MDPQAIGSLPHLGKVNYEGGIRCPDNLGILLTTRDVTQAAEMLNQVPAYGSTLTWNSTPQTGRPTVSSRRQLGSILGRSHHPVWHSWDSRSLCSFTSGRLVRVCCSIHLTFFFFLNTDSGGTFRYSHCDVYMEIHWNNFDLLLCPFPLSFSHSFG